MKWWGCISRIDVLACFSRTVVLLSSLSRDCSFSLSCTFCYARASSSSSTSATRLATATTNRCAYHLVHRRNRELTTKPASHPSTPFVRHIVSTLVHHVPRHKQWHRGKSASAPHRPRALYPQRSRGGLAASLAIRLRSEVSWVFASSRQSELIGTRN